MAISFAMLGTFLDLFGSALTYMGGLPEQTSPWSAIPITSMTLVNLMMPVRVDPKARLTWWGATRSRHYACITFIVALGAVFGGILITLRHIPGLSATILDVVIEVLFIAMLAAVPKSNAASEMDEKLLN